MPDMETPQPALTTTILAIRHGETDWNRDARYQGQLDISLNATGREQARSVAGMLAATPLTALYASDLARAVETANEIAIACALPVTQHAGLREQHFGVFQGLTGAQIAERWPDAADRWQRRLPDFGPEGGESRQAFSQRCLTALKDIARMHAGGRIAVVCHGGVLDCLYRAATGLSLDAPRTWPLENAAINHFTYASDGFEMVAWGGNAHLGDRARDELPERFPAP